MANFSFIPQSIYMVFSPAAPEGEVLIYAESYNQKFFFFNGQEEEVIIPECNIWKMVLISRPQQA
ncbi:hypothetical protein [Burkholderia cepacia]|uniref:hypothetical protein n=1 Tax=Burkholderia cepacia TaxID=292 RepID=UPI000B09DA88|nr:hypothetical protein [Burkholderia cepacia]